MGILLLRHGFHLEATTIQLVKIRLSRVSQRDSSFSIQCVEFFRIPANTRIVMFKKPAEGLPFLSADNTFPGYETLEGPQVLPVLQLGGVKL